MSLKSIRLRNFRSFLDTGRIEMRPIVVLLGANNSGKSSLLRFFPLLRQTMAARTRGSFLWYGDDVDFGDFTQVLRRGTEPSAIGVEMVLEEIASNPFIDPKVYREILTRFEITGYQDSARISELDVQSGGHQASLKVALDGTIQDIDYDGISLVHSKWSSFGEKRSSRKPGAAVQSESFLWVNEYMVEWNRLFPAFYGPGLERWQSIRERLGQLLSHRLNKDDVEAALSRLEPKSQAAKLKSLADVFDGMQLPRTWANAVDKSHHLVKEIEQAIGLIQFPELVSFANYALYNFTQRMSYVGPVRTVPQRFYRVQQLAVDRIAPQGENLVMFLSALSKREQDVLADWTEAQFGFRVLVGRDGSHLVLIIEEGGRRYNLVDTGFGFSQILPVAVQCWAMARDYSTSIHAAPPSFIALEQPELHLHPWYQARLADMLAGLISVRQSRTASAPQVLVETHSEAMLERLGELVEARKLRREDVLVLLVERDPDTGVSTVRQSEFDERGVLENWPIGFFAA
jgi:predicted ATPase